MDRKLRCISLQYDKYVTIEEKKDLRWQFQSDESDEGSRGWGHLSSEEIEFPDKERQIYPCLLRDVTIDRPDIAWLADLTYMGLKHKFVYNLQG